MYSLGLIRRQRPLLTHCCSNEFMIMRGARLISCCSGDEIEQFGKIRVVRAEEGHLIIASDQFSDLRSIWHRL